MANGTSKSYSHSLQGEPPKTTLFRQEPSGTTYRIPSLIYINDCHTFLAFAEKRSTPRDCDAQVLVMRRGTQQNGSIKWSSTQELTTACLPGHRTMNPCPVYERKFKTLFLFFISVLGNVTESYQICTGKNKAHLCYVTSRDSGQSWSNVTDLTKNVIGHKICNWATFAVGPGHGIQMKNGRLIIPAYVYYIHCRCFPFDLPLIVRPHALAFYSDDCGFTWQMGEKIQIKSCECEMEEIIDEEDRSYLYCNARSTEGHRVESWSESGGIAFDRPHFAHMLVESRHGCQGSVLSFAAPQQFNEERSNCFTSNTKTWLIYSHPTDRRTRKDLGIYLNKSPLHTTGWSKPWIIHHGPSGYSDLTQCEEKKLFACLMECGKSSEIEEIAFVEFPLSDLMLRQ